MRTAAPHISVLTATLNAEEFLPRLIQSLRAQTDKNFLWVVADGCSSDRTEQLIREASDLDIVFHAAKDFGIYDALNRGLRNTPEGYYLVLGADDLLEPGAIANYREFAQISGLPDFVAARVRQGGKTIHPRTRFGWLYGLPGVASSHAVGLLIKTSLHTRYGWYSGHFPIAADQLFVKGAIAHGASVARADFLAGDFSIEGTSGSDPLGVLTEVFRVQIRTERYALPQYLLFGLRLAKYYFKSVIDGKRGR